MSKAIRGQWSPHNTRLQLSNAGLLVAAAFCLSVRR
jgi:hypothetical protein